VGKLLLKVIIKFADSNLLLIHILNNDVIQLVRQRRVLAFQWLWRFGNLGCLAELGLVWRLDSPRVGTQLFLRPLQFKLSGID
jgi:hypothetical protein